jgi:hypothetical protein
LSCACGAAVSDDQLVPQIRPKDKGKGGEIQTLLKVFLLGFNAMAWQLACMERFALICVLCVLKGAGR